MSRTKLQKKRAKELLSCSPGNFKEIELSRVGEELIPKGMTRAYSNNRYVVMVFGNAQLVILGAAVDVIKVLVQRHDDKPIPRHWSELQNIKNMIFGHEANAIEFYPPHSELIDQANIYWLWVVDSQLISSLGC
jgi:hypothetical protein